MVILIEGPDSSGKSTLVQDFIKYCKNNHLKTFLQHATYDKEWKMFNYHCELMLFAANAYNKGYISILDRHWPSEIIYGKVFRNSKIYDSYDHNQISITIKYFKDMFGMYNYVSILCLPPKNFVEKRFMERKENGEEMWNSISEIYDEYYKMRNDFHYTYNFMEDKPIDLMKKVFKNARN